MDDSANNTLPDMPTPARGSFGCCTIDSKIYVLGGHVGPSHTWQVDNYTAQVDCYDIGNNQWLPTRTPRPLAAEGFRVAVYEQYIYAFGGFEYLAPETGKPNVYTGVSSDQIDRYDTINDTWETVGKLPRPRSDYMIGIIGTTVYLFGGWSANGITNKSPVLTEVDTFDLATGAIGTAPVTFDPPFIGPPPEDTSSLIAETCARHTAPASDSQAPTISVSESTTSGKIDGGPDFEPEPVLGGATISLGNSLYVFGGASRHVRVRTVWKFNPHKGELTRLPDMPKALFDQAVWYSEQLDTMYVLSGYSNGDYLSPNVYGLDRQSLQWSEKPPLQEPLMFFSVQEIAPKMLGILGGSMNPATTGPQSAAFYRYPLL